MWVRREIGYSVKITITEDKGLVYGKILATDTPDNIRNDTAVQEAYLGTEHI